MWIFVDGERGQMAAGERKLRTKPHFGRTQIGQPAQALLMVGSLNSVLLTKLHKLQLHQSKKLRKQKSERHNTSRIT